jgi:uncharacterized protein YciI
LEFLYRIRPTRLGMLTDGPTEREAEVVQRHASYVQALADRGVVELAGRTQDANEHSFGLVIFRAEDESAAKRIMNEDPAVAEGVMEAELFPYRVAFRGKRPDEGQDTGSALSGG